MPVDQDVAREKLPSRARGPGRRRRRQGGERETGGDGEAEMKSHGGDDNRDRGCYAGRPMSDATPRPIPRPASIPRAAGP